MHAHHPLGDIRSAFFAECEELLERLMDALADPGLSDPTCDAIHRAFRAVHTIKGGAASLGYDVLTAEAHGFEGQLEQIRAGVVTPAPEEFSTLLASSDRLAAEIATAAADEASPRSPTLIEPVATGRDGFGWLVRFKPSAALYATGNEPLHILNTLASQSKVAVFCDLSALPPLADLNPEMGYLAWTVRVPSSVAEGEIHGAFGFVDDLCELVVRPQNVGVAPSTLPSAAPSTATDAPTVRVDLGRVDRLMNLAGELIIGQSMLAAALVGAGLERRSSALLALDAQARLIRELQEAVIAIRTQPIKPLFQRIARSLREAAGKLGKSAKLICEGEGTEVDRAVIEQLTEPLTHMIRNAVDHGLEAPPDRRAAGKPETGEIRLVAANRSGRFVIELADDGAGIDRPRVRDIAVARGLVAADRTLSDAETDALLFEPGFSTAHELTALSGRGVGMDAVHTALAKIGGRISIASTPGAGTRFNLSMPLTLAVLEGLLVSVVGHTLVIPLSAVLETAPSGALEQHNGLTDAPVVRLGNRHVPLIDAGRLLRFDSPADAAPKDQIAILIADEADRRIALLVDDVLEQTQVVIRDIAMNCGSVPGVAAATILGDGQVALILDPEALFHLAEAAVQPHRSLSLDRAE